MPVNGDRSSHRNGPARPPGTPARVRAWVPGVRRCPKGKRAVGSRAERPLSDVGGALAGGDRLRQPLLVDQRLHPGDRLVEPVADPRAGGEGGGQVLHALDDADRLVVLGARGVADVVGHPVEHRDDHPLEHHAGHVGADAAVDAEAEAVVPVAGAGQVDLVGVGEDLGVAVGHRPRQPEPLALLELLARRSRSRRRWCARRRAPG